MNTIKCPVKFTNDAIEFITGSEFMDIELRPKQKQIIEDLFYSFKDNGKPKYNEAVVVCGVRSGKSVISALISEFLTHKLLAMDNPSIELGQKKGQQLTAGFVGATSYQAIQTAYSYFASDMNHNSWWVKYIDYLLEREKAGEGKGQLYQQSKQSINFREKNICIQTISAGSSNLSGLVSYSMVFDELSRFEEDTVNQVYHTLERSTKSLSPFRRVITATTPSHETDFGMQLLYSAKDIRCESNLHRIRELCEEYRYNKYILREDIIAYNYTTYEMVPKEINRDGFSVGYVEDDFINLKLSNPIAYNRDYNAIPMIIEG